LAVQDEYLTGTVQLPTTEAKDKALKKRAQAGHDDWVVDDNFEGLTILSASDNVDLE
jgi:hypothetical protein